MSLLGKIYVSSQGVFSRIADYVLPAISATNTDLVSSSGALLPEHWQQLHFLTGSLCCCCGAPLQQTILQQVLCGACEIKPLRVSHTRSALVYNDASRQLILNFKHGGRVDNLQTFANWMQLSALELLQSPGVLLPVPLHTFRRMQRKFNQSALLAGALAKLSKLPHEPMWLKRKRNTPTQGFLSTRGRIDNVRGAFRVPARYQGAIQGQRIILVDDVRTSGATLEACAQALLAAGAKRVDAITLARIVKPHEPIT